MINHGHNTRVRLCKLVSLVFSIYVFYALCPNSIRYLIIIYIGQLFTILWSVGLSFNGPVDRTPKSEESNIDRLKRESLSF